MHYYLRGIKAVFSQHKSRCNRPKCEGPSSMDYMERGSHEQGAYLTQDTSHMGGNSKGEADKKNCKRQNKYGKKMRGYEKESPHTRPK